MKADTSQLYREISVLQYRCQHCKRWWTPRVAEPKTCGHCKRAHWWRQPLWRHGDGAGGGSKKRKQRLKAEGGSEALKVLFREARDKRGAKGKTEPLRKDHFVCMPCLELQKMTCCCCFGHHPEVKALAPVVVEEKS